MNGTTTTMAMAMPSTSTSPAVHEGHDDKVLHVPSRERSHSYDESFLHRDPRLAVVEATTTTPRAAETPPSFHYRTNFGKSRCYVPPATHTHWVPPQSQSSSSSRVHSPLPQQPQPRMISPRAAATGSASTTGSYAQNAASWQSKPSSPQGETTKSAVPARPFIREESSNDKPFDEKSELLGGDDNTNNNNDDDDDDDDDEARIPMRRTVGAGAPPPATSTRTSTTAPLQQQQQQQQPSSKAHSMRQERSTVRRPSPPPPSVPPVRQQPPPPPPRRQQQQQQPQKRYNRNSRLQSHHPRQQEHHNHKELLARFPMPKPFICDPTSMLEYTTTDDDYDRDDQEDISMHVFQKAPEDTSMSSYEELGGAVTDDTTTLEQTAIAKRSAAAMLLNRQDAVVDAVDDDSLFDFPEEGKQQLQHRNWSNNNHHRSNNDDDDDTDSLDAPPYGYPVVPPGLTQRSQAAWKRKQKPASSPAKPSLHCSSSPSTAAKSSPMSVSFGKDTSIQYYTPDQESSTLDDTSTLEEGRSLNSFYTKSAESEVEDIIKDIFLIGSAEHSRPGRRRIKDSPHVKDRMQAQEEEEALRRLQEQKEQEEEEETLQTEDDEEEEDSQDATPPTAQVKIRNEKGKEINVDEEEDPLSSMWNFFFGTDEETVVVVEDDPFEDDPSEQSTKMDSSAASFPKQKKKSEGGIKDILDYASEFLLGEPSSSCQSPKKDDKKKQKPRSKPEVEPVVCKPPCIETKPSVEAAPSLEEDPRLVELASQAARSMHRIKGQEFDESYNINFPDDIQFNVMDLEMPLGLIFQENDVGCWVTKVLPNGSASMNGKVQVGDQLAAIDGVSAINMTVNDIATIIKDKKSAVELTFMRYCGPLHPTIGNVTEEGYEVRARPERELPPRRTPEHADSPLSNRSSSHSMTPPRVPKRMASTGTKMGETKQREVKQPEQKPLEKQQGEKRRFRLFGRKKAR